MEKIDLSLMLGDIKLNIRDYIAKADYTIQLSDTEAYCYTMIESLLLNVPVIVTP